MSTASSRASTLASSIERNGSVVKAARGLGQQRSLICEGFGRAVIRLVKTNIPQQRTNNHQACSMKGMPIWFEININPNAGKSAMNTTIPSKNPPRRVQNAAWLVPRGQNTPNKNTAVIGGARQAII